MFSAYDLKPGERRQLSNWEKNANKGWLEFWVLLVLLDGPKSAGKLGWQINELTQGGLLPNRQSLYRALRRWRAEGLIKLVADGGRGRVKLFELTITGHRLLQGYVRNNLRPLRHPSVRRLLEQVE